MDRVNDDYGNLQAQEMENIEEDEGYEEPSSSDDVVVILPYPEDMSTNEAIPRYIPSEIVPVRTSVIMPPARVVPDSTTSDHITEGRHESSSSPQLSKMNIVMRYLRELLEPDDADIRDEHLIHTAARDGRTDVVEAFITLGVSPNTRSETGSTPLHEAASMGRSGTIELLLSQGADIEGRTNADLTPIHFTAERGHYRAAFILLEAGAQADVTTPLGITPMDYARSNGHHDIAELLLDYLLI